MNYCQFRNETIKRMAVTSGGLLPSEYQQVEYLLSSGTQFIDTGIQASNARSFEFKGAKDDTGYNNTGNAFFGVRQGAGNFQFVSIVNTNDCVADGYGGTATTTNFKISYNIPNVYVADYNHTVRALKIDGNTIINDTTGYIVTQINIYLFGLNSSGAFGNPLRGMIYYFKIRDTDTDELLRDFIPCYRKSDNKPGMYDLVTDTFFTNAGSGEFTVGNNV